MEYRKSITVEFWSTIFRLLSYVSVFKTLRFVIKNKANDWWYRFVDYWVLGNFMLAFISIFILKYLSSNILGIILLCYGFLRVFEVIIYQVNVLLFDEYRHNQIELKKRDKDPDYNLKKYALKGYRRIVVNLLTNFGEITFWFAASYIGFSKFTENITTSAFSSIYESFTIMTSFGLCSLNIKDSSLIYLVWYESIAGVIMTIISISRFIGMLPKVKSLDEMENDSIV